MSDYRDPVIADLVLDREELETRLADALADRDAYRLLARATLEQLATMAGTINRQRGTIATLRADQRSELAMLDALASQERAA